MAPNKQNIYLLDEIIVELKNVCLIWHVCHYRKETVNDSILLINFSQCYNFFISADNIFNVNNYLFK